MVKTRVRLLERDVPPGGGDVELADVVRRFGPEYTARYGQVMLPSQTRALADIAACRTPEMGGQLHHCDDCRQTFWSFYCCRNRACPKCHASQTQQWLEKRQAELLPCDYFHAVATVPSELQAVFRRQQKRLYGLLMKVSAEAVRELCAHQRHLGALPGLLCVLHTWTRELRFHPHVHLLITGGGITPDGQHFQPARRAFLVPVAVLSRKIAAKFRQALEKESPRLFAQIAQSVWRREWVSFCKHYGHGHDAVLNYLSRYVFRVAITNARILGMDATHVTFRCKDHRTDAWKTVRLPGLEFLRRFLQHVLPRGFHKVRYYGLWHHSQRDLANRAWLLLILQKPTGAVRPARIADLLEGREQLAEIGDHLPIADEDQDPQRSPCPHCGSTRTRVVAEWPRYGVP
jgi:hypothetical protein